jgi:hypothetical protein
MSHRRSVTFAALLFVPVASLGACTSEPEISIEQLGDVFGSLDGFGAFDIESDTDAGDTQQGDDADATGDVTEDVAQDAADVEADVDPSACAWQIVQSIENPTSGAAFGTAISASGDRLAVGETGANGRGGVTLYERSADGTWAFAQRVDASEQEDQSLYGTALDLDEDTLIVGAYSLGSGAVFIYADDGVVFSEDGRVDAPDGITQFGRAVALRDLVAYVGAPGSGSVQEVDGNAGTWGAPLDITAGNSQFLGLSMSSDEDALAVGGNDRARVYIQQENRRISIPLSVTEPGNQESLGAAVHSAGDFVFIGAPGDSFADASGRVFVFEGEGQTWTNVQALRASDARSEDAFGSSMAGDSERLVVGASEVGFSFGRDAVYVFEQDDAGSWGEVARVGAPEGGIGFGHAVAMAGEQIIVADPEPRNALRGSGVVHVLACE